LVTVESERSLVDVLHKQLGPANFL